MNALQGAPDTVRPLPTRAIYRFSALDNAAQ